MKISSNIDDVISFLQSKKAEGYKFVELIDNARECTRECGWFTINPTLSFIFCEQEPHVLGIDARKL